MSRFYGQFHVAEAPSALLSLHVHKGEPLKEVDHEPPAAVLDQQGLIAQGIRTSEFIPGCTSDVDALGSCTANTNTVALSAVLSETAYLEATGTASYADAVGLEKFAIRFYHACTDQTGTPDQEWPPTDCGSSGPYIVQEDQRLKLAAGAQIAHGAQNLVSLLQGGCVLEGGPFLSAWEEVGSNGVVDGNGSAATLEAQIRNGVAGGHETLITGISKLELTGTGQVIPEQTILKVRNSWSSSWGDHGSFYIHLSTLVALGSYYDFRQLTPVPT